MGFRGAGGGREDQEGAVETNFLRHPVQALTGKRRKSKELGEWTVAEKEKAVRGRLS